MQYIKYSAIITIIVPGYILYVPIDGASNQLEQQVSTAPAHPQPVQVQDDLEQIQVEPDSSQRDIPIAPPSVIQTESNEEGLQEPPPVDTDTLQ